MIRTMVIALLCAAAAHGASLVENAQAVKTASDAIDAAIAAKGGTTAGGLANAAAAIAALPSGGKWEVKPWRNDGKTHIWFRYDDGAPARQAYLYAQFISASAFTVDWGDGSTSTVAASASFTNRELYHEYASDGDYEMTVYGYDTIKLSATGWLYNNGNFYQRARFACRQLEIANVDTITGACYCNLAAAVKIHTVSGQAISLPDSCFASSVIIQTISVPLLSIGSSAFLSCSSLQSLGDLSACTSIGSSAFRSCSSLQSLGDLSACTNIGYDAFFKCTSLHGDLALTKLVTLGSTASSSGGVFRHTGITSLYLPELLNLGENSLAQIPGLTYVYAPKVIDLKNNNFTSCTNLEELVMPSVATIQSWGFQLYGCYRLRHCYLGQIASNGGNGTFDGIGNYNAADAGGIKCNVYVKNTVASYLSYRRSSMPTGRTVKCWCSDGYFVNGENVRHEYASVADLPSRGRTEYVYTLSDTTKWRWNEELNAYVAEQETAE